MADAGEHYTEGSSTSDAAQSELSSESLRAEVAKTKDDWKSFAPSVWLDD